MISEKRLGLWQLVACRIAGQPKGFGKHLMAADMVHQDQTRAHGLAFRRGQPVMGGEQLGIGAIGAGQLGGDRASPR